MYCLGVVPRKRTSSEEVAAGDPRSGGGSHRSGITGEGDSSEDGGDRLKSAEVNSNIGSQELDGVNEVKHESAARLITAPSLMGGVSGDGEPKPCDPLSILYTKGRAPLAAGRILLVWY